MVHDDTSHYLFMNVIIATMKLMPQLARLLASVRSDRGEFIGLTRYQLINYLNKSSTVPEGESVGKLEPTPRTNYTIPRVKKYGTVQL